MATFGALTFGILLGETISTQSRTCLTLRGRSDDGDVCGGVFGLAGDPSPGRLGTADPAACVGVTCTWDKEDLVLFREREGGAGVGCGGVAPAERRVLVGGIPSVLVRIALLVRDIDVGVILAFCEEFRCPSRISPGAWANPVGAFRI